MAEAGDARQLFLQVLQQLVEDNNGRIPGVKKVQEATGLSKAESKELLADLKPQLLEAAKAAKGAEPKPAAPSAGAASSASKPAGEAKEMPGSPKDEVKDEVKEESDSQGSRGAASQKALPLETPVRKLAFTPEYPDNQEGLSQATELDTPTTSPKMARADTQRQGHIMDDANVLPVWSSFCFFMLGFGRSIETLLHGQKLLKGKSQLQLPSEDGEEQHSPSGESKGLEELLEQEMQLQPEPKPAPHPEAHVGVPGLPGQSGSPSVAATPSLADSGELPTSKTHKRQWNLLERVANGPRAAAHPELAKMWSGTTDDKRRALQSFLNNDENLAATEASIVVKRRKIDAMNHSRQWLTIRQMHEQKFSELLESISLPFSLLTYLCKFHAIQDCHACGMRACMAMSSLRAKIKAVVSKGGQADPDAPNDPESVRYRCSVALEENEKWENEAELTIQSQVDPRGAANLMQLGDPVISTVTAADPMALVRDQLQALDNQATSSQAPSVAPSCKAKAKPKAAASKGQPFSDVALAGKTVAEKMALVRACLIYTCAKKIHHIFLLVLICSGGEIKKELSQLQSLKLEAAGNASLAESVKSLDAAMAALTTLFQRRLGGYGSLLGLCIVPCLLLQVQRCSH
eukprot:s3758_g11.t1